MTDNARGRNLIAALGVLLLCHAGGGPTASAQAARHVLLSASAQAFDASIRNDRAALDSAIHRFERLYADPAVGAYAHYYAAWTRWLLSASLVQDQKPDTAMAELDRASRDLAAVVASRTDEADFQVLMAWVLLAKASIRPPLWQELSPEIQHHRQRALALAPDNPRVVMLDGTMVFYAPARAGGGFSKGLARWREALALLEAERVGAPILPHWGKTLALGWLANLYLSAAPPDTAAARELATRALAERPDFWFVSSVVLPKITGR
jgi:hypothetical protein